MKNAIGRLRRDVFVLGQAHDGKATLDLTWFSKGGKGSKMVADL